MRRPKKRGPFHEVPVMARATVVRLGKVCPCQTKPLRTTVTVWRTPRCSRIRTVPGLSRGPASSFSASPRYQTVEQLDGGLVVAAIELFLDAPGDHATQQILGEGRRRLLAEHLAPPGPQIVLVERSQVFNLGPDFGFLCFFHEVSRICA